MVGTAFRRLMLNVAEFGCVLMLYVGFPNISALAHETP